MHGPEALATLFHRACERAGIRYVVVGGVAVSAWGHPRATAGVDTLAILDPARVADLAAALQAEGLEVDVRDLEDAARDGSHATIFDAGSVFHIDVKPALTDSEREQVDAGIALELSGKTLRVARPEDVVVFKIHFGTPQDRQDARSIVDRQRGRLDTERMRRMASALGVLEEVERLIADQSTSGPSPGSR